MSKLQSHSGKHKFQWNNNVPKVKINRHGGIFEELADEDDMKCNTIITIKPALKRNKYSAKDLEMKTKCLKDDGSSLAVNGNYSEAIDKWNEALALKSDDETIYEMKAQVLMILEEDFTAVKCAEIAVRLNKTWWLGWLTLGRAQMNFKDFSMAVKSFSRALHLNPCEAIICIEDLKPALEMRNKVGAVLTR